MHLRSITLEGYRSTPPGSPLRMDNIGQFNILIGPNNSGKSTVLRFLQVVASLIGKKGELPLTIPWDQADRSWWWQGAVDDPIRSELVFAAPAPIHEVDTKAPGRFEHDGQWRVTIMIAGHPPKDCPVL